MAEPVYEMLWNCSYCSTQKLLGLTHRHCPNCGAKQDPNARYFPAEHEKVAVQSHEYVGADLVCRYCSAACSRKAHNCGQCGAPLAEGAPVLRVTEPASHVVAFAAKVPSTPPRRAAWKLLVPVALLAVVTVVVLLLVWKKEQRFVVAEHVWQRRVHIERFGPSRQSGWCDQLPAGASDVSRHREQRSTRKVPDGQDCRAKKQDRGDGTFVETQDCSPKLKEEPVYDDKCDYQVVKWSPSRQELAEGRAPAQMPRWPSVALAKAEREGMREETYTLVLRDPDGEQYQCNFAEPVWSRFTDGKSYSGKLRALVGTVDCSSLTP